MLKIRLQRIGKKNSPSYRIVLVEHTSSSKSGRYIELLGSYDSKSKQKIFKKERIQYWLSKGVQLSPTIHNLLVDEKIIDKAKVKAWKPKKKLSEAKSVVEAEKPATPETSKTEESKTEEPPKEEEVKSEPSLDTETKKE